MDNMENLVNEVVKSDAQKVMLQIPAGLKTKSLQITSALQKKGIEVIIANNPCYGACDLADSLAKEAGCDLLVHVGHNKFYVDFPTEVPVLYFPWIMNVNIDVDFSPIKEKRIGLLSTIQHTTLLNDVKEKIEKAGYEAVIGGQVLGCYSSADKIKDKVDAFLYVGSGKFHPLSIRDKKIYALDIEKMIVEEVDTAHLEKRRFANIYNAKDSKSFAILVTSKKGQNQLLGNAEEIKRKLQENQKEAFIIIMNEINNSSLLGIKADAFINTACPRIIEDSFSRPIINATDLNEVLK